MCVCVYLRCSFGKDVPSLNDVSHHSVLQLLVLCISQLDGFQRRITTATHTSGTQITRALKTQRCLCPNMMSDKVIGDKNGTLNYFRVALVQLPVHGCPGRLKAEMDEREK